VTERRIPRQERSRATRDAIIEAAARIFAEVGLERATTARIAEVAGVSPGSMYQYFPNKESLITGIFEREVEEQNGKFLELVQKLGTDDVPALIRALVEWAIDDILSKPKLARVLIDEVPRVSGLEMSRAVDHLAATGLRALFEIGDPRLQPKEAEIAALLLVRTFRYNIIGMLLDGPLEGTKRERFVNELTDMLAAYILTPRPWRAPS
jgi:AcrR family transcriptional regulator